MARINIVNADNKIESNPRRAYFKLKNTGGPKGDTGAQGPQGPKGDTGAQGPAGLSASVTVGSTTTLAPGASATVTNTGDTRNAVLNFGIPTGAQGPQGVQGPKGDTGPEGAKGAKGDTGAAATVTVANTNTGAPGTNASVENVGDQYNAVLNFTIPRGDKGETGATGAQGPAGQDGKDFTPTVVTALPETGENGVLYMTEKAHTTQTATGNPITATITDEAGKMESFQLDGGTFQNSYTGKNLMGGTLNKIKSLNQSGTWTGNSYANNGITWTVYENSDGTIDRIEASGTAAEAGMTFRVMQLTATDFAEKFDTSSTYTLSGCPSGGSSATYYIRVSSTPWKNMLTDTGSGATGVLTPASNYTRVGFTICVDPSAGSVNNLVFRPQLELNSSATAYEPYCGGQPSPNPEFPQPIQTVTGEQTISINGTEFPINLGKNLFDKNAVTTGVYINSSGATQTGHNFAASDYIPVVPNAKYYYSGSTNLVGNMARLAWYKADKTFISASTYELEGKLTAPADAFFFRTSIRINAGGSQAPYLDTYQFEAGDKKTDYAPYFAPIKLCKLGDAQDSIYYDGADWILEKQTVTRQFNGNDTDISAGGWFNSGDTNATTQVVAIACRPTLGGKYNGRAYSLMTHFHWISDNFSPVENGMFKTVTGTGYPDSIVYIRLGISKAIAPDVDSAKAWIAANKPTIYMPKLTPIQTTITNQALIAQLEAIRTALLENGANTIANTAAGSNLAGDMEIGYYGYTPSSQYDKWLWLDVGAAGAHYEQI